MDKDQKELRETEQEVMIDLKFKNRYIFKKTQRTNKKKQSYNVSSIEK